ncbi:MAG TPA: T9SS type A sorting domain-containing protein, partial [Bacteroidia bacterium]|nr:T9SS type A sorting domain-containing protein [Bacteroidia bacterium]
FLDDINFNSPLGVNELTKSIGFNVFPNPTSGSASIVFNLSDNADVKYYVTDITGRIVESEKSMNANPGEHILTVNENNSLKSGVYLVHFELNGQKMSRKLIVE